MPHQGICHSPFSALLSSRPHSCAPIFSLSLFPPSPFLSGYCIHCLLLVLLTGGHFSGREAPAYPACRGMVWITPVAETGDGREIAAAATFSSSSCSLRHGVGISGWRGSDVENWQQAQACFLCHLLWLVLLDQHLLQVLQITASSSHAVPSQAG